MNLSELKAGESAVIVSVSTEPKLKNRLFDMGLTEGAHVKAVRFAPTGDPMEIKVRDFYLAIRKLDASKITIRGVRRDER